MLVVGAISFFVPAIIEIGNEKEIDESIASDESPQVIPAE
jgi:hypothetical protein